jgi:hypothetical protein
MSLRFPIFFLSYDEPNAEENWALLSHRFSDATRIHGIQGILQAHQACAESCSTSHFFVVDGDNQVLPNFHFLVSEHDFHPEAIHVWRCKNPVNDLVYGYGAIKLFPAAPLIGTRMEIDLSTGLGVPYKILPHVASETHFHASPFHAWRGAFRESAKLTWQLIEKGQHTETAARLETWCTIGADRPNGRWAILGANAGKSFAMDCSSARGNLKQLNDFDWLKTTFIEKFSLHGTREEIHAP